MNMSKEDIAERVVPNTVDIVSCDQLALRDQRAVVFHILYALDADEYQLSVEAIVDSFCRGFLCMINRHSALYAMVVAVVDKRDELDASIKPLLHNWRFERISVSTRLILRMALWELTYSSLDALVVLNEAVELAKSFAEVDSYKFINGVLDEWLKRHRANMSETSMSSDTTSGS